MAMIEDTKESFCGKLGSLTAFPKRSDPSPTAPAATLMVTMVPTQYDSKNARVALQEVIASAGARLGAPSQEKPCKMPMCQVYNYKKIKHYDTL